MSYAYLIIGLVCAQRLAETVYGRANAQRLIAAGGREHGAGHYPLIVAVHVAFLACLAVAVPADAPISAPFLGTFIGLQAARVWMMAALGRYWTTRIITLPGAPLIKTGPYRYLRHPNYWIVAGEIATLPAIFGAYGIALAFTLLNGIVLGIRIRAENAALADRRDIIA